MDVSLHILAFFNLLKRVLFVIDINIPLYASPSNDPQRVLKRESALASSALSLLLDRNAWDEMSDSDWDSLSTTIADLLDEIIEAI